MSTGGGTVRIRRLVVLGGLVMVLVGPGGCANPGTGDSGGNAAGTAGPAPSEYSAPPEAYRLRPDGSVPWTDEPVVETRATPRSPAPGSKPCQAKRFTGTLATWNKPNTGGERARGFDANISRLYGWVDLHNTSSTECTLRGGAPATMLAGGTRVPMDYHHDIGEAFKNQLTVVPAGGHAQLRVDWDGPFCLELTGTIELAIVFPDGGGTLRAAVTTNDRPLCNTGAVKPTVKGAFSSSGFIEASKPTPVVSYPPTERLFAAATGPASARPGERFEFRVALENPTGFTIGLDPCPTYQIYLIKPSDPAHLTANQPRTFRLNCRPIAEIGVGAEVSFAMMATVPADLTAGQVVEFGWSLITPKAAPVRAWVSLTVA